jgi:hypothetical protein
MLINDSADGIVECIILGHIKVVDFFLERFPLLIVSNSAGTLGLYMALGRS